MIPHDNAAPSVADLCRTIGDGDGLIVVDHMDAQDGFNELLAAARRSGRAEDVRVLDAARTAPVHPGTTLNTFNPFARGTDNELRELLGCLVEPSTDAGPGGEDVFRQRALQVLGALAPVLAWLRDTRAVPLDATVVGQATGLQGVAELAFEGVFKYRDPDTGDVVEVRVDGPDGAGEARLMPLRSHITETSGYDPSERPDRQRSSEPSRQHAYTRFFFSPALSQLTGPFGHIFKGSPSDVDMEDVLTNARILIIRVPSLEMPQQAIAPLIRLVLGSLRVTVSRLLAGSLETLYSSGGEGFQLAKLRRPVQVVLGASDAQAIAGMDRLAAMGRSVGIRFYSGFAGRGHAGIHAGARSGSVAHPSATSGGRAP
jgi:intracellular multiplication protein IcmO